MIRRVGLASLLVLAFLSGARACDLPMPPGGSRITWPERVLVARVRVLSIWRHPNRIDLHTRVRLVSRIRGDLPKEFGIVHDRTSCGWDAIKGEVTTIGLMRRQDAARDSKYAYQSNSYTNTWVGAVFLYKRYILID